VNIQRTKIFSNESDLEKSISKEISYKEFFKNSMIKYPKILEYPEILENYIIFNNEIEGK
jgi:hypothetical protein